MTIMESIYYCHPTRYVGHSKAACQSVDTSAIIDLIESPTHITEI